MFSEMNFVDASFDRKDSLEYLIILYYKTVFEYVCQCLLQVVSNNY